MTRWAATCFGLALASATALHAQNLRPFEMDDDRPVRRAIPVATPIPMGTPMPVATPIPVSTPIPMAPPEPVERPQPPPQPTPTPAPMPTPEPTPTPTPPPATAEESLERISPGAPTAPARPSQADELQLELANGYYARKLYDVAAPEFEKYLGMYPRAPGRQAALFRLAESYRILGNTNAARGSYEQLLGSFNDGEFVGPASYRLADIYFKSGNYRGALPFFRKAAARIEDPLVINAARFHIARAMEKLDSPREAREVYQSLVAMEKNNPYREASRLSLARLLSDAGKKSDALEQFKVLAKGETQPEIKAEALVRAGLLEIELEKFDAAAADLKKALAIPEIGQWKDVAQLGLVRLLHQSGKFKEAISTHASMAEDFSEESRPEALLLVADAHRQLGQQKESAGVYEELATNYAGSRYSQEAGYQQLVALYNASDPALIERIDAYLASNAAGEKRDRVALMKAEALYKQEKYAAAAEAYAALDGADLPPDLKAEAMFKLGWCYMQTGESKRAIDAFTKFLGQFSSHKLAASALAQRALAHQQAKDLPAALADFDELIRRHEKAPERELALQQKALLLGQQKDNEAMVKTFQQLLRDYPKSPAAAQAHYWIGSAAFDAKDYKAAIPELEAAAKDEDNDFFERALQRVMLSHYWLEDRGAVASSVDRFAKAGKAERSRPEILRWLGEQYLVAKEFEPAAKYLAMLVERKEEAVPNDSLNLGRAQLELEQFEDAAKSLGNYLEAVTEPYPRASGLLEIGEAQLGQKNLDAAQKSADEALTLQPEGLLNAKGRILTGDIQMERGNPEEAAKLYQAVSIVFDDPQITPLALEKAYKAIKKAGDAEEADKLLNELQTRYPEYWQKNKATISA